MATAISTLFGVLAAKAFLDCRNPPRRRLAHSQRQRKESLSDLIPLALLGRHHAVVLVHRYGEQAAFGLSTLVFGMVLIV